MILKDFIEQFVEPNTLIRLQYKTRSGHEHVGDNNYPEMEWKLKDSEYANHQVVGVTDILYHESCHSEAVNIVIERKAENMNNQSNSQELSGVSGMGCATDTNINTSTSSGTCTITIPSDDLMYFEPKLLSAEVFLNRVEHVYSRYSKISSGWGPSYPQIFKITITWNGTEMICEKTFGNYVPACPESYNFDGEETID